MIKSSKCMAALAALSLLAAFSGCGKKASMQPDPMAKVACDESFENILEQEINVYEYIYPKEDVLAYYLPENACIDSIMAMQGVKCAVTTRPLTEKEVSFLRSNKKIVNQKKIAVDALAIIVNPENPVEILSKKGNRRDPFRRGQPLGSGRTLQARRDRRNFRPSGIVNRQVHARLDSQRQSIRTECISSEDKPRCVQSRGRKQECYGRHRRQLGFERHAGTRKISR